jgi:PHP family Zn ribbon phosphoesterase
MTKYEQPPRFGQTFIFWKCKKCGKMVKEKIVGTVNGLGQQTDSRDKPSD